MKAESWKKSCVHARHTNAHKKPFQAPDIYTWPHHPCGPHNLLEGNMHNFWLCFQLTMQVYLLVSVLIRKLTKGNENLQMLSCGHSTACGVREKSVGLHLRRVVHILWLQVMVDSIHNPSKHTPI